MILFIWRSTWPLMSPPGLQVPGLLSMAGFHRTIFKSEQQMYLAPLRKPGTHKLLSNQIAEVSFIVLPRLLKSSSHLRGHFRFEVEFTYLYTNKIALLQVLVLSFLFWNSDNKAISNSTNFLR